ncbi:MAG: M48 family metallopeptidase [Acidobacteria bacterium]|nr:M48 family metallopeptidase [Acidobacteriota bacterium]
MNHLRRALVQAALPFDDSAPNVEARSSNPEPRTRNPIFVRHPRARRYVIRVADDGTVRVTVPRWGSKREAMAFAQAQRAWIERQRKRVEQDRLKPRPAPMAPEVERAFHVRAARELPARLLELAAQHGLTVSRVSVRNQRWRWGSCSPNGHICLNWRLVTMPEAVRDYVLIHELMHLKRLDHSPKFWKLVAQACPHYQDARRYLRSHGSNTLIVS